MSVIANYFTAIWDGLGITMNIYGFSLSFRDILVYSLLGCILFGFIGRLFNGG